ncbi:hypothetical protein [Rhodobacter maris]|uniref:Uncharacterized protein n=1 Tax=Rhodobacter maris TaxID=446682 RepID=A0A285TFT4_9RHOB|nr:hypothetical protein [Rhodobacter maris]SOC20598.1 hypothetical protein SAMN05877831_1207 [Rhodobacter maris]
MFTRVKSPEFNHPVKVSEPVDGGHRNSTFTGRFRVLTIDEASRFDLMTAAGTTSYLQAIFVGWGEDYVDEGKTPVPYSDAERDSLISTPYVRMALLDTYNAAMMGAKRGN